MKKATKIVISVILIFIVIIVLNTVRNISIIKKVNKYGSENTKKYAKLELNTELNGENFIGIIDNDYYILPERIPILNKILDIIIIEDNCYKIKVSDITYYVDKNTGLTQKTTSKAMKSTTTYKYISEENENI